MRVALSRSRSHPPATHFLAFPPPIASPLVQCFTVDGAIRFSSISIIARGVLVGPLGEISARCAPALLSVFAADFVFCFCC